MSSSTKAFKEKSTPHDIILAYPKREPRYSYFWLNRNHQACYTKTDLQLLKNIINLFQQLFGSEKTNLFFATQTQYAWYNWWKCTTPTIYESPENENVNHNIGLFTLPNRNAKDSKNFPLWDYADTTAKMIANWQSERVKNQKSELLNDPVMLVFDELRHWFYYQLTDKECKSASLTEIAQRQSYLKSLIHLIPHFGPDRLRLHLIGQSLNDAAQLVRECVANKALPQLLTDLVLAGKNLETTLSTYLHFLLINEEVSDNFSLEMLEAESSFKLSPLKKLYQSSLSTEENIITKRLPAFSKLTHFIKFIPDKDSSKWFVEKISLDNSIMQNIDFASFVTAEDKMIYLESVVLLEALVTIRNTFEEFNQVQSKTGTYAFAYHYVKQSNQLAGHYLNLIDRIQGLLLHLVKVAESGQEKLLRQSKTHKDHFFGKNLRSLETQFAKGTTVSNQLQEYCQHTIANMHQYQLEMQKLVSAIESGKACNEIREHAKQLYENMYELNKIIPALFGAEYRLENHTYNITSPFCLQQNDGFISNHHCEQNQLDNSCNAITYSIKYDVPNDPSIPSTPDDGNTFLYNSLKTIGQTMGYGFIKGGTQALTKSFFKNPGILQTTLMQTTYFGAVFLTKFCSNLYPVITKEASGITLASTLQAGTTALVDTLFPAALNLSFSLMSNALDTAGNYLVKQSWVSLGSGLKKIASVTRYGLFAGNMMAGCDLSSLQNAGKTLGISAASIITGATTQQVTETITRRILSKY